MQSMKCWLCQFFGASWGDGLVRPVPHASGCRCCTSHSAAFAAVCELFKRMLMPARKLERRICIQLTPHIAKDINNCFKIRKTPKSAATYFHFSGLQLPKPYMIMEGSTPEGPPNMHPLIAPETRQCNEEHCFPH
eukprot:1136982-Pelagomonas_calceolata.AAC.2